MFRASCATSARVSLSLRSVAKVAAKVSARKRSGRMRSGLVRFGLIRFGPVRFSLVRMRSGAMQSRPCKRASSLVALAVLAFGSCVDMGAVDPIVAFIIATAIAASSGVCAVSLNLSACCICRFLSLRLGSRAGTAFLPLSVSRLPISRFPFSSSRSPIPVF